MLFGRSVLSVENVGWALCVLEFHLLWIESDYEFYSGFDNEIMHKYFVYSFCFILQSCPVIFKFFFFYQQGKSKLCRVVFLYVVVLAEQ